MGEIGKVKWTVNQDGWEEEEVLVLERPRIGIADPLAQRMVRLRGDGMARVRLELLDDDGAIIAQGTWTREVVGGRGWDLMWAWEIGDQALVQGEYNWEKFDPLEPHCPGDSGQCLRLWLGWYVRDPVDDQCIDATALRVQPVDGQSVDEAVSVVNQALGCCGLMRGAQGVNMSGAPAKWVTVSIPDPSMYLGVEFRLYCAKESGLALTLGNHLSTCLY
jgi:hypothetical protein